MAITLNGTTGITTPAVASSGGDTNTTLAASTSVTTPLVTNAGTLALSATGSNVITASTNGTERMRIDSSGNLALGTTTIPFNGITVTKSSASCYVSVYGGTGNEGGVLLGGDNTANKANLIWNPSSSALVMVTNQSNPIQVKANQTNGVQLSANGTSWSSLSDENTKDIIEPIANATEKVSSLRAVIGKYKTDEDGTRRSFLIAQDVQAVLPEAVSDFNNADGTTNLALSYTDVIPLLVASIQELKAELDAVKTQLADTNLTLADAKARIETLENK